MNDIFLSPYLTDDCPPVMTDYSEDDRKIDDMLQKAESIDELASIFSDELVRSIKEQLSLK